MQNMEWYHSLNQPVIHPPDWVFAPVWSILYILMFISLFLFLEAEKENDRSEDKAAALAIFIIQLLLNLSWSPVFFGLKNIEAALIILVMLWIFTVVVIVMFYKHSKISAFLLLPYFLWTTFALYLNYQIFRMN